MLRIYIIGLCILLIAIIANVIVGKLGVSTWYDFGPQFFKRGLIEAKIFGAFFFPLLGLIIKQIFIEYLLIS